MMGRTPAGSPGPSRSATPRIQLHSKSSSSPLYSGLGSGSSTRIVKNARPRTKLAFGAGLLAVVMLWLVTPTPRKLYDPKLHSSADKNYNAGSDDINNSIIVPSYNEAANLPPLVTRIFQSLPASELRHTEVLIIDDNSSDNTAEEVERLREGGYNVHLHVRKTERGLSSAVLHGFSLAHGAKLVVMDADLQHPPENVYDLLSALPDKPEGATIHPPQFALGTRYGKGVEIDRDWPMYRRIISWGARELSRPLTNAQDPMGGFFALRKELFLKSQPLNPSGFKIGLELLLKTPLSADQLVHVPYGFAKRQSGYSKLGVKVIIKYVGQLLALYHWKYGIFFYVFVGVLMGTAVYALLIIAEWMVLNLGYADSQLGRILVADRKKKRRVKSDV